MRSTPGTSGRRRSLPTRRQRALVAGAVSVAVLAGGAVGWQVRAAQAAERRAVAQQEARAAAELPGSTVRTTPPPPSSPTPTPTSLPTPPADPVPSATSTPPPTAAAPTPSAAQPAGAGPDCGGPGSYEPPVQDGRPIFYTSTPTATGDGSNGRIPASAMAPLAWCQGSGGDHQWLRADAAAAMTRLNDAFRAEFGENVAIDLSYRSYDQQVAMKAYYGSLAATPGTSSHGWGTAIDIFEWAAYSFGAPRYDWLVLHAPEYGWVAPTWARVDGSNPEYWHYEFTG